MNRLERARTHIRENKTAYIAGTVGVLVGAAATVIVCKTRLNINGAEVVQNVEPTIKQIGWRNEANQVIISLVERSTPSKPVRFLSKDGVERFFSSINEAARETGHHASMISKNVNGALDDVKGDRFELLDLVS